MVRLWKVMGRDSHQSEAVEVGMAFEYCLYHVCSHFGISDPFEFAQDFELWQCGSEYTLNRCSVYRKEEYGILTGHEIKHVAFFVCPV
jgi:hypothetical protein